MCKIVRHARLRGSGVSMLTAITGEWHRLLGARLVPPKLAVLVCRIVHPLHVMHSILHATLDHASAFSLQHYEKST